ncbi:MAG: hypothetical protein WKF84_21365 [Pyrinomonadaceae bacterium]
MIKRGAELLGTQHGGGRGGKNSSSKFFIEYELAAAHTLFPAEKRLGAHGEASHAQQSGTLATQQVRGLSVSVAGRSLGDAQSAL